MRSARVAFVLALGASLFVVVFGFMASATPSFRGLYYLLMVGGSGLLWRSHDVVSARLQAIRLPQGARFAILGVGAILVEETLAGLLVNLTRASSLTGLVASVPPYWANNLLLLPGYLLAWYLLLQRFSYSRLEVVVLSGLWGLYAEKTLFAIASSPIMGLALVLPTMLTYAAILGPPQLSLPTRETRALSVWLRWPLALGGSWLASVPFVLTHSILTQAGWIDPSILRH